MSTSETTRRALLKGLLGTSALAAADAAAAPLRFFRPMQIDNPLVAYPDRNWERGRAAFSRADLQLKPRETGQLHLGAQAYERVIVGLLDAPEIQGVPHDEVLLIAPTATQTWTADHTVEHAAYPPGQCPGIPTVPAANALDDLPQVLRARMHLSSPLISIEGSTSPVRIGWQPFGRGACRRCRRPRCRHVEVLDLGQGQLDRSVESQQALRWVGHVLRDVLLAGHDLVAQRFDEWTSEAGRDRSDQAHPMTRQPG